MAFLEKISKILKKLYIIRPLPLRVRVLILLNLCLMTFYHRLIHQHLDENADVTPDETASVIPRDYINTHHSFDPDQNDFLVFLHIQKTGGSKFEQLLTESLIPKTGHPCNCLNDPKSNIFSKLSCKCLNSDGKSWLYTRLTSQWYCGVHADWSRLNQRIDSFLDNTEGHRERQYHYITMLRDPLKRYLSEWKHVARGATWEGSVISCFEDVDTASCYNGTDWKGVTLREFMDCPNNNAHNRQVMMAASMKEIGCSRLRSLPRAERDKLILESAKETLRKTTFFGFTDDYLDAQNLLQLTFDVKLNSTINSMTNIADKTSEELPDAVKSEILALNNLDVQFHKYARELYRQRFTRLNS